MQVFVSASNMLMERGACDSKLVGRSSCLNLLDRSKATLSDTFFLYFYTLRGQGEKTDV